MNAGAAEICDGFDNDCDGDTDDNDSSILPLPLTPLFRLRWRYFRSFELFNHGL